MMINENDNDDEDDEDEDDGCRELMKLQMAIYAYDKNYMTVIMSSVFFLGC